MPARIQRDHAVTALKMLDLVNKIGAVLPVAMQQDQRLAAPLFPIK